MGQALKNQHLNPLIKKTPTKKPPIEQTEQNPQNTSEPGICGAVLHPKSHHELFNTTLRHMD